MRTVLAANCVLSLVGTLLLGCGEPAPGDGPGDTPPATSALGSTSLGPFDIAPGEERTVCIVKRLDNPEDIVADTFIVDLAPVSHHLIVYRSTATEEQLTPKPCRPFEQIVFGTEVPLFIATRAHTEYRLPEGVGLTMEKGQMVKIEAHYLNAGATMAKGSATIAVQGKPMAPAGDYAAADVAIWGTARINIPARKTFQTPVVFQPGVAGTKAFALTTHEHHLGTRAQVWASAQAGDTSRQLADDTDWASPAFTQLEQPFAFDGKNGFSVQCDWNNTTDKAVRFGEGALDEMCFVILYYYPSRGTDVCIDGRCSVQR
jgi:hypothetical protein